MSTAAYSELYLYDAIRNLGACFDYGINECGYEPDLFMSLFLYSGVAKQFGECNPRYICGMSGTELAIEILSNTTDRRDFPYPPVNYLRSKEYWAGWVLAMAQWQLNTDFEEINRIISFSEIISLYHPLHESDESKFIEIVSDRLSENPTYRRLNMYRQRLGLSQKDLSLKSGVALRSIQQYEIGAKDINKASYNTVRTLEDALGISAGELYPR